LGEELHVKMDRLVEKYSELLFTLPSRARLLAYLIMASLAAGLCLGLPFSAGDLLRSLAVFWALALWPLSLSLASILAWAVDVLLLRGDPMLDSRRCLGLELFSLAAIGSLSAIGGVLSYLLGSSPSLALRLTAVGASLAISARSLVLVAASLVNWSRGAVCALAQPAIWLVAAYATASSCGYYPDPLTAALPAIALAVGALSAAGFLLSIRSVGMKHLSSSPFRALRGFSACWLADLAGPLEDFLNSIGAELDVEARVLLFEDAMSASPIGALVVPGVHPGPFRRVGSSALPSMVQEALEARLGCPVAVPHGLSGHDLNLTSRAECEKLLSAIISALEHLRGPYREASPITRSSRQGAKASCQLLGRVALLALTAAPEPMEDLPPELGRVIEERARGLGLEAAVIMDAHNSIDGPPDRSGLVERFSAVALDALEKAAHAPRRPFKAGMARVVPSDFSLEDGMGPGGITVLALEVPGQKVAYVVIDGNNMVQGLRERLLAELRHLGFQDGEVMTTDTHIVNALLLIERGYHPVGEVMDWDVLARHVREAALQALKAMKPARIRWAVARARLKVFGAEQLDKLCDLPSEVLKATKRGVLGILAPIHAALLALAFLL